MAHLFHWKMYTIRQDNDNRTKLNGKLISFRSIVSLNSHLTLSIKLTMYTEFGEVILQSQIIGISKEKETNNNKRVRCTYHIRVTSKLYARNKWIQNDLITFGSVGDYRCHSHLCTTYSGKSHAQTNWVPTYQWNHIKCYFSICMRNVFLLLPLLFLFRNFCEHVNEVSSKQ